MLNRTQNMLLKKIFFSELALRNKNYPAILISCSSKDFMKKELILSKSLVLQNLKFNFKCSSILLIVFSI